MASRMISAAAVVVAWAGSVQAAEMYAKPGATAAQQSAVFGACQATAANIKVDSISPTSVYSANGYAFIAASVASGIMTGVRQAKAEARFRDACMRKDGWARVTLTRPEAAAYEKTSGEARAAWVDNFLKTDALGRVQAALAPKAPKLPSAGFEPAVAGVVFDPAILTAAPGPVARGQIVLSGKVAHRLTATLSQDVVFSYGLGSMHAAKGAVYQLVDFRPPDVVVDDDTSSFWCAKASAGTQPSCFWSDADGYHFGVAERTSRSSKRPALNEWLVASPEFAPHSERIIKAPVLLDVSNVDLLGPMDFALRIESLDPLGVQLAAVASRDGAELVFWNCFVRFDESGKAVVPFWTHRLILRLQGDAVTAVYVPGGDGKGLGDVPEFKSANGF
jgi:hypothetical protein